MKFIPVVNEAYEIGELLKSYKDLSNEDIEKIVLEDSTLKSRLLEALKRFEELQRLRKQEVEAK